MYMFRGKFRGSGVFQGPRLPGYFLMCNFPFLGVWNTPTPPTHTHPPAPLLGNCKRSLRMWTRTPFRRLIFRPVVKRSPDLSPPSLDPPLALTPAPRTPRLIVNKWCICRSSPSSHSQQLWHRRQKEFPWKGLRNLPTVFLFLTAIYLKERSFGIVLVV
jgi:hypothetical protein